MRIIPFMVGLLVVSPAFAQSRVFTNADLGKPLTRSTTLRPDEAAAILAPYQFVDVAPREWFLGPTVTVVNSSPTAGPFGEFREFGPSRRLDGSFFTDSQWSTATYGGWQGPSLRGRARSMGPMSGTGFGAPGRGRGRPRRD